MLRVITEKSADGKTLSLDKPLLFDHLSVTKTVGTAANTRNLMIRAEVGLLTRNVLFRGNSDDTWAPLLSAPACPGGVRELILLEFE